MFNGYILPYLSSFMCIPFSGRAKKIPKIQFYVPIVFVTMMMMMMMFRWLTCFTVYVHWLGTIYLNQSQPVCFSIYGIQRQQQVVVFIQSTTRYDTFDMSLSRVSDVMKSYSFDPGCPVDVLHHPPSYICHALRPIAVFVFSPTSHRK